MNEDLVSIIIPAYNVEKYIEESINSVIQQSYSNIEIIIINDGSIDRTIEICEKIGRIDNRIKIINKKNEGVAKARNDGIKNCNGKYIAFVDSDDIISRDYIKSLMYYMKKYNADIVSCNFKKFYKKIKKKKIKKQPQITQFNNVEALELLLYKKTLDSSLWNKIIKKDLFNNIAFDNNLKMFEDLDIMYRLFDLSNKIIYVDEKLYYYRVRPNSLINKEFGKENYSVIDVVNSMKQNIINTHPDLEKACNSRLLSMYFYLYRNIDKENQFYLKCVENIKTLREKVEKDNKISNKTKIGIWLSKINLKLIKIQNLLRIW